MAAPFHMSATHNHPRLMWLGYTNCIRYRALTGTQPVSDTERVSGTEPVSDTGPVLGT